MQAILTTFGIDWRLLLVNIINFGLLLAALWYFLYGPVTKMLEERRQRVAQGVADAEAAAQKLAEVEVKRREVLGAAGKEADEILLGARSAGSAKERELVKKGESSAAAVLREAEAQAAELKTRAIDESRQEVAKLIVLGIEKALKQ